MPQEHWTTYFHITNPNSQNWLWFLPVLFTFNLLYALIRRVKLDLPKLSVKAAVGITFALCVAYTFSMDLLGLKGWTLTPLLDFQNERLLIYFMFFLLGTKFKRCGVLDEKPRKKTLYLVVNSLSWLPVNVYIFIILWPLVFNPGNYMFSRLIDRSIVALTFNMSLFLLAYMLVESFRFYGDKTRRIGRELNRNSYAVYIIHVIVTGLITLLMRGTAIPSLVKHLLLAIATFVASNLVVSGSRAVFNSLRGRAKKITLEAAESI
jgi:surface polysaccharide O-acyltransferase-like enzyme